MAHDRNGARNETWIAVAVEEYKTLREESLQAQRQHHAALQVGISGVAVLVALAVGVKAKAVAAVILLAGVPLLVDATILIWLGELNRMARAGAFVVELEQRLNRRVGSSTPALTWEQSLRRRTGPQVRLNTLYRAIFTILLLLGLVGVGAGIGILVQLDVHWAPVVTVALVELLAAIAILDFFARTEVALHDLVRGAYPGAALTTARPRLGWARPVQDVLDVAAVIRGRPMIARNASGTPRLTLPLLAWAAVTGHYPRWTPDAEPDCVIGVSFGFRGPPESPAPGPVNDQIAAATLRAANGLPRVVEPDVGAALRARGADADVVAGTDAGGLSSRRAAEAIRDRLALANLSSPIVVAHPRHVARACACLLALGVHCRPAEDLTGIGFDELATTRFTRGPIRWILREVKVLASHLRRGSLKASDERAGESTQAPLTNR